MSRGGARKGAGRKPLDPSKKRKTRAVALTDSAWLKIREKAASSGRSTNDVIQAWAERIIIL